MEDVTKITWSEMCEALCKFNEEHGITSKCSGETITGVVVFDPKKSNWKEEFLNCSLESRSYRVSSSNKAFIPNMCSNSIFASCLDGIDVGVRLDNYIYSGWVVDYCYLEKEI